MSLFPKVTGRYYFKGFADPAGRPLSGDRSYQMHFTKDQLPAQYATYFW